MIHFSLDLVWLFSDHLKNEGQIQPQILPHQLSHYNVPYQPPYHNAQPVYPQHSGYTYNQPPNQPLADYHRQHPQPQIQLNPQPPLSRSGNHNPNNAPGQPGTTQPQGINSLGTAYRPLGDTT